MVERVLLKRMREKLGEVIALYEKVCDEWYRKCEESMRSENLTLYGYSKLLEEMQGRVVEFLQVMERLAKLEKEVGQLDTVDEAVRALAYYIMELSEEERREVLDFIKRLKEGRRALV
jgi:signal recognition particle GTPase